MLRNAVAKDGFFAAMTPFEPPAHYCSFLREKIQTGQRKMKLEPCGRNQRHRPYATFDVIRQSR